MTDIAPYIDLIKYNVSKDMLCSIKVLKYDLF